MRKTVSPVDATYVMVELEAELSLFGKRSPEAHGVHLAKLAAPFTARVFMLSKECGFVNEDTLVRASVLVIALVNQMFVHSDLDLPRWPEVQTELERQLVIGIVQTQPRVFPGAKVDSKEVAKKVTSEAKVLSNSIVLVAELAEKQRQMVGMEEALQTYYRALLGSVWTTASNAEMNVALNAFQDIFVPYFRLPVSKYLTQHFLKK